MSPSRRFTLSDLPTESANMPKTMMVPMPSGRWLRLPEQAELLTPDEIKWLKSTLPKCRLED
jgi:hypothetical protein